MQSAADKLTLARRHLKRVLRAWPEPTAWDDLSLYGFYCLENAVEAAAKHFGIHTSRKHWEKAELARDLHHNHGLPAVEQLLRELNEARKAAAYGDVEGPDLDAAEVAMQIELFVEAVAELLEAESGADD